MMAVTFRIGYLRSSRAWGNDRAGVLEKEIVELLREELAEEGKQDGSLTAKLDYLAPPGVPGFHITLADIVQ